MGMDIRRTTLAVWLALGPVALPARADSPITSTPIADAYLDIPLVQKAREKGVLTPEMAEFLSNPQHPVDHKAALINALSWRVEGKQNARLYEQFLRTRYGEWNLSKFTPDEVFALAYLTVMDNYFRPERAMSLFDQARLRNRHSLTVAFIRILNRPSADGDDPARGVVSCLAFSR